MDFFFAIRYSAFKAPIGVDSVKTKPDYLHLFLYLTTHKKKMAPNGHFENFDFGSGGARSISVIITKMQNAEGRVQSGLRAKDKTCYYYAKRFGQRYISYDFKFS